MQSKISLLPDEFKRRNKLKKQMYTILTAVISMSVFLTLMVSFVLVYRLTLNSHLSSLKEERQNINLQISKLKKFEDLNKKITALEVLYSKSSSGGIDWRDILIKLSTTMPGGVNISELSGSNGKSGTTLKLKGYAIDNYRLGLWLQNLRNINELQNVQCSYSERKKISSSFISNYEISANLTPALPPQKASSKEVKK